MTEAEVTELIRDRVKRAGSMLEAAKEWGVSVGYVCDLAHGRRRPGPSVLGPLGLVAVKTVDYVPVPKPSRARRA